MELKRKSERRADKDRRFGGLDAVYFSLVERRVVKDSRTGRARRGAGDRRGAHIPIDEELYIIHILGIEKLNAQRKKNRLPLLKNPTFEEWKRF